MKCVSCNDKKGSTRCEGCGTLLCLSCVNKHQNELMQQFQQLLDTRNELKESVDIAEKASQHENKLPCIMEINQWELETIERIRKIANRTRANINQHTAKYLGELRCQLEELSDTMQQQQKEENYLENDLEKIKLQINQLKETIPHINTKIHLIISNNIDWDTLIYVITDHDNNLNTFPIDQENQSNTKFTSKHRSNKQSDVRSPTPVFFESVNSGSFRPISPSNFPENDSSSSERNAPLFQNIVPPDRIVTMLPTLGQSFTKLTVNRKRQNT